MKQNCCPVVSAEMSGFQPLNLIPKKKTTSYYMLGVKVLHFTVVSRRLFSQVRGRISGNDNGKKGQSHIRFRLAKQKLCTCITGRFLWYIFLPSLHSRLISRFFFLRTWSQDNNFLFLFVNLDTVQSFRIQLQNKITNIWQIKRVWIKTMKF